LVRDLTPHSVSTIAQEGWGDLKNGLAVIELFAKRTTVEHIEPLLPELRNCIDNAAPGVYYTVGNS